MRISFHVTEETAGAGPVILAFDGGGTRTRCVAADRSGRILGIGHAGPSNVVQCSPAEVRRSLQAASRGALTGLPASRVRSVAAGLAGVFPDGRNREPVVRVLRGLFRRVRVVVTGDAVIALRGAIPEGHGVVAVSGTGSSVFGASLDSGSWARVGGGGAILGDEGSGHRIAVEGLRAAWRACDGRGEPTALGPQLARALGVARFEDAVNVVYGKGMTRDRIAGLSKVVAETASRGDLAAQEILRRAGHELGLAVAVAIRSLAQKGRCAVSWQGSVFDAGPALLDAFSDTLRSACPLAAVRPPVLPAVGGAFLLGLEQLGEKVTAEALETFARDFNAFRTAFVQPPRRRKSPLHRAGADDTLRP
jgi:N-acetylglucosamine kinase-like BadF-type ATPase